MTEQEAINLMLAAIGQAPITGMDETVLYRLEDDGVTYTELPAVPTNPDVAICKTTLYQVSREVQSEGWTFNTTYNEKVSPRANDNRIVIRSSNIGSRSYCIQMDLSYNTRFARDKDSVAKADGDTIFLYNRTDNTFDWGTEPVEVDKVMYINNLGELPPPAYNYIVAKASADVSMRTVGDTDQYRTLKEREDYCRTQLQEYEMNQGDYTFFGHPKGGNFYNSYKPFHTLSR